MTGYDYLILGGGYAGTICAQRLAGRLRGQDARIALVNPRPEFVERLRLHEGLAADRPPLLRSFDLAAWLEPQGVTVLHGRAEALDPARRRVSLTAGDGTGFDLGYRRLVLALGSRQAPPPVPGLDALAFVLEPDGTRGIPALRAALAAQTAPRVVVIGGGATGIEVAAEIAGRPGARVTLIDRGMAAGFARPPVARRLRAALARLGVQVIEDCAILGAAPGRLDTDRGPVPFDIVIAATGFAVPDLGAVAGLPAGPSGRLLTDPALRSTADPAIFVAGDAALPERPRGAGARMSVFYAMATGAHVADALADERAGRRLRPFGYWTYGQAIGLGREAVGFANFPYDRALPPYYTGRTGYHLRHFFIWLLFAILRAQRRWPGLPFALGRPRRRSIAAEAPG